MFIINSYILLFLSSFSSFYCLEENPRILVIGAGSAGIAAAAKLWKANFTNLKILEAENRTGGRIQSIKFGDAFVDLGAQWVHGEKDNIVYNTVNQLNILKHANISVKLIYSTGEYIDQDVYHNLIEFSEAVDASQVSPEIKQKCKNLASTGECFEKVFRTIFTQKYKNAPEKLRISLEAAEWLQNYMVAFDSPLSLKDLSKESDYRRCEGDLLLNWNGLGFKTILEVLLQKYPNPAKELPIENNILLNKEVSKIFWSNSNTTKVLVKSSDNSVYEADYVIFTPSLGVLKAHYQELFEPALPIEKVTAIKGAGYGAILKIILHFPETWWNPHEAYELVWSTADKNKILSEYGKGPVKNGKSWLTSVVAFLTAEDNPKVLIGFFAGELVPEIEKESDQILKEGVTYMFRKFLGSKYSVIEPDRIIKTTWYSNPHFLGTYSYESVAGNSTGNKFPDKLASPLRQANGNVAVLFAGEATHPYYFSTVHGAIESGYREADRIINLYTNKNV